MTAPVNAPQYCWIQVGAVVAPAGPDTLFGHGTAFGTNPTPVENEGQYDLATGQAQRYSSASGWQPHKAMAGDEYMDMDSGITYGLTVLP
jgi:hypothetical protein